MGRKNKKLEALRRKVDAAQMEWLKASAAYGKSLLRVKKASELRLKKYKEWDALSSLYSDALFDT